MYNYKNNYAFVSSSIAAPNIGMMRTKGFSKQKPTCFLEWVMCTLNFSINLSMHSYIHHVVLHTYTVLAIRYIHHIYMTQFIHLEWKAAYTFTSYIVATIFKHRAQQILHKTVWHICTCRFPPACTFHMFTHCRPTSVLVIVIHSLQKLV